MRFLLLIFAVLCSAHPTNAACLRRSKSKLVIEGDGNIITIGQDVELNDHILVRGSDNRIKIGDKVALGGHLMVAGNGQSIDIGNGAVGARQRGQGDASPGRSRKIRVRPPVSYGRSR